MGAADAGLIGRDCGLKLAHEGLLCGQGLLGDNVGQSLVSIQINFGVLQLRLVLQFSGFGLIQGGLVGGRINLGQQVVGMNVLPFCEGHFDQLAINSRGNGDRVEGLDGAQAVEINGDVLAQDQARGNGNGGISPSGGCGEGGCLG